MNYVAPAKPTTTGSDGEENKDALAWLSDQTWRNVCYLEQELPVSLQGFCAAIAGNPSTHQAWATSDSPFEEDLPGDTEARVSPFVKLTLVKVFREEKAVTAA